MKIFDALMCKKDKCASDKLDAAFERLHRAIHDMLTQHKDQTIIVLPIKTHIVKR